MNAQKLIQDACYDKLAAAGLTVWINPDESDDVPYTILRAGTVSEGQLMSKTHDGFSVLMEMQSWANNPSTAQANAATGVSALIDRNVSWSVSGFLISQVGIDFIGSTLDDISRPNDPFWIVPYTVRFEVEEQ